MSKQTRKERKEEEARVIAEMEEAMKEKDGEKREAAKVTAEEKKSGLAGIFEDKTPETIHCRKCKTVMENGVCPTCGFRMYTPMDKKTQQRIRWIAGIVCVVVFLVLFIIQQTK